MRQQTRRDTDLYISEESKVPDLWTCNDFGTVVVNESPREDEEEENEVQQEGASTIVKVCSIPVTRD